MTDTATSPPTAWYRPEFPEDTPGHVCYCREPASGRTRFWDGHKAEVRWQCKKHMPVEPHTFAAVSR